MGISFIGTFLLFIILIVSKYKNGETFKRTITDLTLYIILMFNFIITLVILTLLSFLIDGFNPGKNYILEKVEQVSVLSSDNYILNSNTSHSNFIGLFEENYLVLKENENKKNKIKKNEVNLEKKYLDKNRTKILKDNKINFRDKALLLTYKKVIKNKFIKAIYFNPYKKNQKYYRLYVDEDIKLKIIK